MGEVISLNISGTIILNNNLTYNNTILLISNNLENPLILNCQSHSITFNLFEQDGIAIWLQNNNQIGKL